jgi:photosystem II oxygen-evolving enhancer protein 2
MSHEYLTQCSSALGEDIQALGEKLAAKRDSKLINADERLTDGILFYVFEFAINDGTHQILSLSVNKGKIWSLDLSTSEKRWPKRKELYYNIVGSFLPKLV